MKAIEVIHRRLLGRPTFGRWEIDALFDTAARKGFYGVVDVLIDSREYNESFGEDTVPFERFITPNDLNVRRTSTFKAEVKTYGYDSSGIVFSKRPDPATNNVFRSSGDLTPRNMANRTSSSTGTWNSMARGFAKGPDLMNSMRLTMPGESGTGKRTTKSSFRSLKTPTTNQKPLSNMGKALVTADASGFSRRAGLPDQLVLQQPCSESELRDVMDASYRQLLNRVPLDSERLISSESRLRNQDIDLDGFLAEVAMGDSFQNRIASMAPLRAASAAGMALLGRATTPAETSRFLITRAQAGQGAAVSELLAERFGDSVPRINGMDSPAGLNQATIQRTAALYRGNAGLNPPTDAAI